MEIKFLRNKESEDLASYISMSALKASIASSGHFGGIEAVNVVSVTQKDIAELHSNVLGSHQTTDVISIEEEGAYEVYVSIDYIRDNLPKEIKLETEVVRLVIHGFLHCLGHDHEGKFEYDNKPQEEIFELQEKVLNDYLMKI